ncbi:glyoxylate/hydroxypyruvate reductase HPR3 [Cynara cardunculus var. scolymus]|uniref:glyoxylate/hydroxypyruvate reductase HPR3 n=1 Tax=Cynara cardunculus var. scolymus TaxID=59895 RepID=UPI000D62EFF4|nr:glyoxylate/hydroxypyruvate reductase HPR3 [Cynara cardunculus var. scolymus]
MAGPQPLESTFTTDNHLPVAIIHHLPIYTLSIFHWIKEIINPLDPSDPSFLIHGPSARAVIVLGPSPLKSEHLDQYPSVEIVVGTSAGVDHIDLAECRRRNIHVTGAGDAFSEDVADYAIALLLDVLRRVSAADRYVRSGLWPVIGDYPLGNKLGGKRVGIVGFGSIGTMVGKRLEPFGCSIAYTSRNKKSQIPYPFYSTVLELATASDALILCCSLSDKTHHIVNREVLMALGKRGILVNIGRGAIVDEKELVKVLGGGELGGAGLDVYENEPEIPKELFTMDNVVLSPHRAVLTPESFGALKDVVIGNLKAFFSNKPLLSQVNLND